MTVSVCPFPRLTSKAKVPVGWTQPLEAQQEVEPPTVELLVAPVVEWFKYWDPVHGWKVL